MYNIFIFTDAEFENVLAELIQYAKTSEKVNNSDTGEWFQYIYIYI